MSSYENVFHSHFPISFNVVEVRRFETPPNDVVLKARSLQLSHICDSLPELL